MIKSVINSKRDAGLYVYLSLVFVLLVVGIALCVGWVMNIIALIGMDSVDGMLVARVAGIFIAPFGGVLGYF